MRPLVDCILSVFWFGWLIWHWLTATPLYWPVVLATGFIILTFAFERLLDFYRN